MSSNWHADDRKIIVPNVYILTSKCIKGLTSDECHDKTPDKDLPAATFRWLSALQDMKDPGSLCSLSRLDLKPMPGCLSGTTPSDRPIGSSQSILPK